MTRSKPSGLGMKSPVELGNQWFKLSRRNGGHEQYFYLSHKAINLFIEILLRK